MALIENIFRRRKIDYAYWDSRIRGSRAGELALEQVRLLLYKECDRRGRKVLFDSSTIDKVLSAKNDRPDIKMEKIPCIVEVTDGNSYIYKGQATDASVLGEMIFGAVAMNCKSVSFKIHIMNEPKRLMCTKLFSVPVSRKTSRMERKADSCSGDVNRSRPLNMTLLREEGLALSFSLDRGDSGFCETSSYSSFGTSFDYLTMFHDWDQNGDEHYFYSPSSKLSASSGSLARRTSHSYATRFDFGNTLKVPTSSTVCSADSQLYSSSTSTSDSLASTASTRRAKLGLALLITFTESDDMELIRRCLELSPQLRSLVCRLRLAALTAGSDAFFVSTLHTAAGHARRWLSELLFGPRLHPTWLLLVSSEPSQANKMADRLIEDICSVLAIGDTKDTNFFISTLLTHVLTHHLGWVTTVSPYDRVESKNTGNLDTKRPYNALWAQLTDLCGCIGFPPKSARTIITGNKNILFINRLLDVLTYFIRCGDVKKNDFVYRDCSVSEVKVIDVKAASENDKCDLNDYSTKYSLKVPSYSGSSASTLVSSEVSLKKSATFVDLNNVLSNFDFASDNGSKLRRHPTMMISLKDSDSSSNASSEECEKNVVFVLGDDEKLVGLKNKSNGKRNLKKTSRASETEETEKAGRDDVRQEKYKSSQSPKCCDQTLKHSKPIKHSGFKFEFDKYPQIVTNYMKSKNLEILDRHYIGKPGNLKLDNFQFDPTFVPPIQEDRCETCYKCQLMESMLQTPTNASEMEYMNDIPRQSEPQIAKETIVQEEMTPKTFVRKRKESTVVVNVRKPVTEVKVKVDEDKDNNVIEVKQVLEFPVPQVCPIAKTDCNDTLLGGITDHYVPDLILQGTIANPDTWESELRRDLDLTSYLNKSSDSPIQTVAIVGDTNTWQVRVCGRSVGPMGGGLSPLVGGILDALPAMRKANVPAAQCQLFLESKLREFCVLSKTLADILMSTDFCDIATLTKSLNVDVNDVPLLLAVATTHTPELATRYGISYR
ncbi:folliculin-interacting protein 2 isoform X3 [Danaus plexippus]|uniref:folliculin-interacting protein 2 isoform X3 n=1 Tax=Danaus plexippus TaxID=13037 RepID=UPI002AB06636|nr:folliculin-interacting protein 2 isoform X3 [Danaus plexippus]